MKKTVFISLACGLLTGICFGGLEESLERRFASVVAKEDGLLLVFNASNKPYGISVVVGKPPRSSLPIGSSKELGQYFIPYDQKWPVRIGHKDSRIYFVPFSSDIDGKGFILREAGYLHGGKTLEKTGTLFYLDSSSSGDHSYEIVDEKEYIIISQPSIEGCLQPPITNELNAGTQGLLDSENAVTVEEAGRIEKLVSETNAMVTPNSALPEPLPQTGKETTSSPWEYIFMVIAVFLAGFLAFFKFRKR